jgi:hypothetical protein
MAADRMDAGRSAISEPPKEGTLHTILEAC